MPVETVRDAYPTARRLTKAHCLEMLARDIRPRKRAFWLEKLASVVRMMEELSEADTPER